MKSLAFIKNLQEVVRSAQAAKRGKSLPRILFVCSPTTTWGGGQKYLYRVLEIIQECMNWNIFVAFLDFSEARSFKEEVRVRGAHSIALPSATSVARTAFYLSVVLTMFRPRLVHINGVQNKTRLVVFAAKILSRCKVCLTSHLELISPNMEYCLTRQPKHSLEFPWRGFMSWYNREYYLMRFLLNMLDKIIFVNEYYKYKYTNLFSLSSDDTLSILNGIDTESFNPCRLKTEERKLFRSGFGFGDKDFVICGVGNLVLQKRFDYFIKTISALKREGCSPKGLIIGKGPLENSLKSLALNEEIAQSIVFAGYRSDMADILCSADCFLMPSDDEGLPYALLEAKACGLPSVATRVGGITEVIRDTKDGFLVQKGNLKEMTERIRQLAVNETLRKQFQKEAQDDVSKRFTVIRMQHETLRVLQKLMV